MKTLPAETRADRAGLGIAMVLTAWAFFAATDTTVKWLVLAGLPAMQLAFMRYFVSFILSLAVGLKRGVIFEWSTGREMGLVLLRGSFLISATLFNFIALKYLPLSVTSAILNSSPIILTALAVPLLGERVGRFRWIAVLIGFLGVLIVIRPFDEGFHWATLLMLFNAIALALFAILTRRLSGSISTQTMQVYMGALGTAVLLPGAILTWQTPATTFDWVLLCSVGLWAWFGHEMFGRAHAFAEASVLMPFSYAFILYLTVAGFLVLGTIPDRAHLIGATIIVGSGLVIWWRENAKAAKST